MSLANFLGIVLGTIDDYNILGVLLYGSQPEAIVYLSHHPHRNLETYRVTFSCHNLREKGATGTYGVETKNAFKHPITHGIPQNKGLSDSKHQ